MYKGYNSSCPFSLSSFVACFDTDDYTEAVIKELKHCPELEKVT